ncbi:MAG: hypothetical protein ABI347_08220 [Nitrososphaera sp.]
MACRPSYALRIKESHQPQLRVSRSLYVGIRRDWSPRSKIVLLKKGSGDFVVAIGTVGRIIEIDSMAGDEKKMCIENNWYAKIVFSQIARLYPPVPVSATELASVQPALLHGHAVSDVSKIESMSAKIIIS